MLRIGKLTALISFLIGTTIFGIYFLTSADEMLFIGYGFIAIAGIVNIIILAIILFMTDHKSRKELLLTIRLMLLNIPIMLIYCSIIIYLTSIMRITFVNATDDTLEDINIVGCESKHIDKLEKSQSKTVWIGISGDCTIDIYYIVNGEKKEENVVDYVTNGMGQKIKHNIGGQNANW